MPPDPREFLEDIATTLAWYYAVAAGMNVAAAWRGRRSAGRGRLRVLAWSALAVLFSLFAVRAWQARPPGLPEAVKWAIDAAIGPVSLFFGSLALLAVLYLGRRFFVRRWAAWGLLNAALIVLGLSLADPSFAQIVLKADNVPIVAMIFLLGFFNWLGASQAVENDARMGRGQGPAEIEDRRSTLVWPDLVYIELITMVVLTSALVVWSLVLRAPLEQPANPVMTPNPSKAPWYFLGLQEMLVFFDPSIAGVILPGLIILGLAAIPYLDFNPKGRGYYTIQERRFAYLVFQFGFLQLWILLILVGTFMRGPNWTFFGPYEPRDLHKVLALNNVKLSEYFWVLWLGRGIPEPPPGAGGFAQLGWIVWREIAGLGVLGVYFIAVPLILGRTILGNLRRRMGTARYAIMILLLLMMLAVPLKMVLRWTCHLSYVVHIPEYYLSF